MPCYVSDKYDLYNAKTNGYSHASTSYSIDKNNSQKWLAGGNGGNVLAFSNNGIDWYDVSMTVLTSINSFEYNGAIYVAGGEGTGNTIAYSENGLVWYGGNSSASSLTTCNALKCIGSGSRGDRIFIGVGDATTGNSIAYSRGGVNWTGIGNPFGGTSAVGRTIEWNGVYYLAGASFATPGNALCRSTTGINWTPIDVSGYISSVYALMWSGSQWIMGGNTGGTGILAYSTNDLGTAWTTVTNPQINSRITSIAFNGSRMVAVGNGSTHTIAYSDDMGTTWTGLGTTYLPNTASTHIHKVHWSMGRFVIAGATSAGGTILYSKDGIIWRTGSAPGAIFTTSANRIHTTTTMHNTINFPTNKILCGNSISYDGGTTWTQVFAGSSNAVGYNGKYHVFGGDGTNTRVTYDLSNVFQVNIDLSADFVEWNGSYWLMGGLSQTTNHLLRSYDGFNWTAIATSFMTSGYRCTGADWSPNLKRWSVATQTGVNTVQMLYSSDGANWYQASNIVGGGAVRWAGSFFIASVIDGTSQTKIAVSQDGITWSAIRTINGGINGPVLSIASTYFSDENNTTNFVCILTTSPTSQAGILRSTNGSTWTAVGNTSSDQHLGATWDGLRFIVKTNNATNSIRVSYDGSTWTSTGGNLSATGKQLVWSRPHMGSLNIQQQTIVCGRDTNGYSTMTYSKNGIFYQSLGNTLFSTVANNAKWNGRMWIACGEGDTNTLGYSYDGIAWTGLGKTVFTTAAYKADWNGSQWVAVGDGGNTVATSVDGFTWIGRGTPVDASGLTVAWNGTTWLVGGRGATNTLAYSSNGTTWTGAGKTALDTYINDVQWFANKWIVCGSDTSSTMKYTTVSNGQSGWTDTTPASNTIFTTNANAVYWNGEYAIAVGEGTNTIARSSDGGITWVGQGTTTFSTRGNDVMWNEKRWVLTGSGGNTIVYGYDGITWRVAGGTSNAIFTEGVGIGANSKMGIISIPSAIWMNDRDKICVNTPKYYDVDLADDTSLTFNLNV